MATIGQSGSVVAGPVVVGDDHVDAEPPGLLDLGDGGDAAVDREDELHALLGQARDRRRRDAVALLEPARQVPADVGADLPQRQHGERRRADAVDVVVAVDADPLAPLDRRSQALHGRRHVAEEQRIVGDALGLEERPGRRGIAETAAHEHGRERLRDVERGHQLPHLGERDGLDLPAACHAVTIGPAPDGRSHGERLQPLSGLRL